VKATIDARRQPQSTASANVQARLFKSGPVQSAMLDAMNRIRDALGVETIETNGKKRLRAKEHEHSLAGGSRVTAPSQIAKAQSRNQEHFKKNDAREPESESDDEWNGLSASDDAHEASISYGSDAGNEEYAQYAARLAASSDDDSASEGSHGSSTRPRRADLEITPENSGEEGTLAEIAPTKPPRPKKVSSSAAVSTTFLPSLAMGGYWSGSEEGSNDAESDVSEIQARKNRRGQQARRALWEKKFGKNANHVKKQANSRDQGWDSRKGASGGDERGRRGRGRGASGRGRRTIVCTERGGGNGNRPVVKTGANSDPVGQKRKMKGSAEGPLHPSWEAAKKAKEQKKAVAFQGKKVVFN